MEHEKLSKSAPWEIDVSTVQRWRAEGVTHRLLDCRRPDEYAFAHIHGAQHLPMEEMSARVGELGAPQDVPFIVYCHHGGRSLRVAQWLRQQGWIGAQSMAGGIDAWSQQIDPSVPRY